MSANNLKKLVPALDWDSGGEEVEEREKLAAANTHTEHWNNSKVHSSTSSPVSVTFVRNDIGFGGSCRRGGALMDPPPNNNKKPTKPETRPCLNCDQDTTVWHSAERFTCDEAYADDPDELAAHNQLCTACATDEARCPACPRHPNSYYKNDEDEVPSVVWSSGQ